MSGSNCWPRTTNFIVCARERRSRQQGARDARSPASKWLWKRLRELAAMEIPREEMLMKLGAARSPLHGAWSISRWTRESSMFVYPQPARSCGGSGGAKDAPLLRTNLTGGGPRCCRQYSAWLVAVEEGIQRSERRSGDSPGLPSRKTAGSKTHIFMAFLAYCLQITLAPGLTARSGFSKKFCRRPDDRCSSADDRRAGAAADPLHTQPEPELKLLIQQLRLQLPPQPPPRIAAGSVTRHLL